MYSRGCKYLLIIILALIVAFVVLQFFDRQNSSYNGSNYQYCDLCLKNCHDMGKSKEECKEQCKDFC